MNVQIFHAPPDLPNRKQTSIFWFSHQRRRKGGNYSNVIPVYPSILTAAYLGRYCSLKYEVFQSDNLQPFHKSDLQGHRQQDCNWRTRNPVKIISEKFNKLHYRKCLNIPQKFAELANFTYAQQTLQTRKYAQPHSSKKICSTNRRTSQLCKYNWIIMKYV